jgi:hypothetical protein
MSNFVVATLGLQDIDSYNETTMVGTWLNQGTLDLLSRTRCVARCVQLTTKANQDTYLLDHKILALIDSEIGSDEWGNSRRRYRGSRMGSSWGSNFSLLRSDLLQVNPAPSEDGTMQVWAVLAPTAPMANPADDPSTEGYGAIPPEFHDALILYALWKLADYGDDATSQQGERYRALYEGSDGRGGRLGQIRSLVNKKGTSIPTRRRVRLRGVSSSDSYVGG